MVDEIEHDRTKQAYLKWCLVNTKHWQGRTLTKSIGTKSQNFSPAKNMEHTMTKYIMTKIPMRLSSSPSFVHNHLPQRYFSDPKPLKRRPAFIYTSRPPLSLHLFCSFCWWIYDKKLVIYFLLSINQLHIPFFQSSFLSFYVSVASFHSLSHVPRWFMTCTSLSFLYFLPLGLIFIIQEENSENSG